MRLKLAQKGYLGGYLVGRSVVLVAMMPLAMTYTMRLYNIGSMPLQGFFLLTGLSFLVTLLTGLHMRRTAHPAVYVYNFQPLWDIIYVTGLLYLSGGWYSPFLFLYLLTIIGSAIILPRAKVLVVATQATFFYGGLTALQVNGIITPPVQFVGDAFSTSGVAIRLTFHIVAFYIVGLLSGYLSEELRRAGRELKEAQDEILNLEHLQGAILQSMGSGLLALDNSGVVMFQNQFSQNYFKAKGLEIEAFESLLGRSKGDRNEAKLYGRDSEIVLGYSVFPLTGRTGDRIGSILTFQDLTEIRKLEEGLKRADRMAAVGRLAAGLAHEIRNPLASLSGSVQMLEGGGFAPNEEERLLLSIVLRETDRLNHLVTDFLSYARPGKLRTTAFNLRGFIDEMELFYKQGEGATGFTLINEVAEDLPIKADHEQLESLILNLMRNSTEAAPDGVVFRVAAHREGEWLVIEIEDDGPGIPPEVAERAFEPFVSSKANGTGLGLATVHRIVQEHGGAVTLSSGNSEDGATGAGTAFTIKLPAAV